MNSEFEIIISPRAARELKAIEKQTQINLKNAIMRLAKFPPQADVLKLKGGNGREFRLRAGDWRIIFEYRFDTQEVYILTITNRRDAYR